jgi:predicted TIM-barrel fold metal-dependent hydrolase
MPADDTVPAKGLRTPDGADVAPCIDMHVHLHPPRLAEAIQRWFAREGWANAHPFDPDAVAATLHARGVERFCFFSYAHKPGIARGINEWVARTAERLRATIPLGTLHVDDADLLAVADEALGPLGLAGFKLHLSVQRFRADDPRLFPVYERVEATGRFMVLHAGTMPYRDPFTGLEYLRPVLMRFPALRLSVAHMGAFEARNFLVLTREFPNLYLDTTMAMTPAAKPFVGEGATFLTNEEIVHHQDRIMFGSDFPLVPYDYDEERRWAYDRALPEPARRKIFYENARRFLGLSLGPAGA